MDHQSESSLPEITNAFLFEQARDLLSSEEGIRDMISNAKKRSNPEEFLTQVLCGGMVQGQILEVFRDSAEHFPKALGQNWEEVLKEVFSNSVLVREIISEVRTQIGEGFHLHTQQEQQEPDVSEKKGEASSESKSGKKKKPYFPHDVPPGYFSEE